MSTVTAITVAQFHTALVAVTTAMDVPDYKTAWVEIAKAEIVLAGLPLTAVKEGLTAQLRSSLAAVKDAVEFAEKKSSAFHYEKRSIQHP